MTKRTCVQSTATLPPVLACEYVAASAAADVRAAAQEVAGQRADEFLSGALLANESKLEQIAEE